MFHVKHLAGLSGRGLAPYLLAIAGLAAFTAAGFTVSRTLGLLIAGVSCFVLEIRIDGQRERGQRGQHVRRGS